MNNQTTLLTVSHAPFLHNGTSITEKSYNIFAAALIAVIPGLVQYGVKALSVVALAVSSAMLWELLMNVVTKRPFSIVNGNSAVIGLLFAMMLPPGSPWWLVITGTFVAVIMGKEIFGGIGANPFNPVLIGISILMVSWKSYFDFTVTDIDLSYSIIYPLEAIKHAANNPELFDLTAAASQYNMIDLLMGRQVGGIGSTCGLALIIGGIYLFIRGYIRWEITLSFLAGVFISAYIFNMSDSAKYVSPMFHILSGYTLIGAIYLATEDSSSPVNFVAMLIYGAGCGILTVLIRNMGIYVDGVVLAILFMNLANPLIDKIKPKAMGKAA